MWGKRRTKCGSYTYITGEAGSRDGEKAEKEDTTAWDKL
jgi:hypothetical protein